MITSGSKYSFSTLGLAVTLSAGISAPVGAATNSPATAASAPVTMQKAMPKVDELVIVESIQLTPVNLASKIIGSAVYGSDNKKVGDVKDILIGENNKLVAVTVGVGGFLGIDETYMAFPMKDIKFSDSSGSLKITTDLTKAAIEKAAKRK